MFVSLYLCVWRRFLNTNHHYFIVTLCYPCSSRKSNVNYMFPIRFSYHVTWNRRKQTCNISVHRLSYLVKCRWRSQCFCLYWHFHTHTHTCRKKAKTKQTHCSLFSSLARCTICRCLLIQYYQCIHKSQFNIHVWHTLFLFYWIIFNFY